MRSVEFASPFLSGAKNSTPLLHVPLPVLCRETDCAVRAAVDYSGDPVDSSYEEKSLTGAPTSFAVLIESSVCVCVDCEVDPPPVAAGGVSEPEAPPPPQAVSATAVTKSSAEKEVRAFMIAPILECGVERGALLSLL